MLLDVGLSHYWASGKKTLTDDTTSDVDAADEVSVKLSAETEAKLHETAALKRQEGLDRVGDARRRI